MYKSDDPYTQGNLAALSHCQIAILCCFYHQPGLQPPAERLLSGRDAPRWFLGEKGHAWPLALGLCSERRGLLATPGLEEVQNAAGKLKSHAFRV